MVTTDKRKGGFRMSPKYDKLVYTRRLIGVILVIDILGEVLRRLLAITFAFWRQWKPLPQEPKRILVLRTEQIGDLVLSLPSFQALRKRFPDAYIAVLVQPVTASLLKFNPHVNEIIACKLPWYERRSHPARIKHPVKRVFASIAYHWRCLTTAISLGRQLSRYQFDVAVDLGGHIYSLLLMVMTKTPVRIGSPISGGKFLLTHWVLPEDRKHEVERCLDIVGLLGAQTSEPQLSLSWAPEDEVFVNEKLLEAGIQNERLLVAIHPFSVAPSKNWNVKAWAKVADWLVQQAKATVIFIGSAEDREKVDAIRQQMQKNAFNLCGQFSLLQLAALLGRCDLVIGVDSAPAHIAAAVGTPVISVWSSAYLPEKWAPRSPQIWVIRKQVPCADCRLEVCPKPVSCMDMITPEEVIAAAKEMLQEITATRRKSQQ